VSLRGRAAPVALVRSSCLISQQVFTIGSRFQT
jgi:hypothetical protein